MSGRRLYGTVALSLLSLLIGMGVVMRFAPAKPDTPLDAIGSTSVLPEPLRRALEPRGAFQPLPKPGPHDWLANHPEKGQTFADFAHSGPNRPDARRHKLYFQPLGAFRPDDSPPLDRLKQFASAFFAMEVEVLPPLDMAPSHITTRRNPSTGKTQLLTSDILALLKQRLPNDAFALLGITMEDLYPDPAWNFVFGQASLHERVGVYSFSRYDPRFFGETPPENWRQLLLRRSCKILAHETGHMFGIEHCIYYQCLMNGSNHLAESDARPMHLCPVDLRKLQYSVGFDVVARYRRLRDFCQSVGFEDESRWLTAQLEHLTAAKDKNAGRSE